MGGKGPRHLVSVQGREQDLLDIMMGKSCLHWGPTTSDCGMSPPHSHEAWVATAVQGVRQAEGKAPKSRVRRKSEEHSQ